jgi:hypothetical protein
MNRKEVEARFRDSTIAEWQLRALGGWYRASKLDSLVWASTGCLYYRYCQVYAPPQWFVDKPEPGEGYRLLEKFPDEALQPGDEVFQLGAWRPSLNHSYAQGQSLENWYRRRIEQPKPQPKHYVLQVGDSVETPCGNLIKIIKPGIIQRHLLLKVGDTISTPSGRQAIVTEHGIEVT